MVQILDLPVELLEGIVKQYLTHNIAFQSWSSQDQKNLRATCAHLKPVVEPILFKRLGIRIDLERQDIGLNIEQLRELGTHRAMACQHTQHFFLGVKWPIWKTDESDECMREDFRLAMASLRSLRSIQLEISPCVPPNWIIDALFDATPEMLHLEEFSLFFSSRGSNSQPGDIQLPIHRLPPLRKLGVHMRLSSDVDTKSFVESLIQLIDKSPDLVHFKLELSGRRGRPGDPNFVIPVLNDWLPEPGRLSLKHLRLSGFGLRVTPSMIMHLRSLTSLEVWGSHIEGPMLGLWETLRRERIFLLRLHTSRVDDHLIQYLASFSGLQELYLSIGGYGASDQDTMLDADTFFEQVLPRHASTLQHLHLVPHNQANWSFDAVRLRSIMTCTQLVDLSLVVKNAEAKASSNADSNLVLKILDTIPSFPRLRTLRLERAETFGEESSIAISVKSYQLPVGSQLFSWSSIEVYVDGLKYRSAYTTDHGEVNGGPRFVLALD